MDPAPYGTLKGRTTQELFALVSHFLSRYFHDRAKHCGPLRRNKNGAVPKMSDVEVLTVVLVGELKQLPSERAWYFELSTEYRHLCPNLLSRSRLVKRRIALSSLLEAFRRKLLEYFGLDASPHRFVDSKPVILAHFSRASRNQNKRFRPRWLRDKHADLSVEVVPGFGHIGKCATKSETYFGMKLHMVCTFGAIPTCWCLTAANVDDRAPICELLECEPRTHRGEGVELWCDNGYWEEDLERRVVQLGHRVRSFPKKRDFGLWPRDLRKMIRSKRQKIETKFSEGKRFLGLERPRAASLKGLMSEIGLKITALTFFALAPLFETMEWCLQH